MTDQRIQRRTTFDEAALLYDAVRPGYARAMFDDLIALSGVPAGGRILEVGPGTGQATLPLAERGYAVDAIELGANLAAVAQHKLAAFPRVTVQRGAFEEAVITPESYDVVFSATAWHWIDPAVRYVKAVQVLKPNGALALCWNIHVSSPVSRGFFENVQEVYAREAPQMTANYTPHQTPHELQERTNIERSGLFGDVVERRYEWTQVYSANEYVAVLNTYSDHLSLPPLQRKRLFHGIADLINARFDGRITKAYVTLLYVAHKLI